MHGAVLVVMTGMVLISSCGANVQTSAENSCTTGSCEARGWAMLQQQTRMAKLDDKEVHEAGYSYGPGLVRPALEYYRFWSDGAVKQALKSRFVTDNMVLQQDSAQTEVTTEQLQQLVVNHVSQACPAVSLAQINQSWHVYDSSKDADGVHHVLLYLGGSFQYLAHQLKELLASEPSVCPSFSKTRQQGTLLQKLVSAEQQFEAQPTPPEVKSPLGPQIPENRGRSAKTAGGMEMLNPAADPLAKDCALLFHRTAKHNCAKDFTLDVKTAQKQVIAGGFAVYLGAEITGPAGKKTYHSPECTFMSDPTSKDASFLEVLAPDITSNEEKTSEEKNGMSATLLLHRPLCQVDESDGITPEAAHSLAQMYAMGELSRYKGYEHVNDALPHPENVMALLGEGDVKSAVDLRTDYPKCFPKGGQEVVRAQGSCGSCWAFASASTTMAALCISGQGGSSLASADDRYEIAVQHYELQCEAARMQWWQCPCSRRCFLKSWYDQGTRLPVQMWRWELRGPLHAKEYNM